MRCAGYAGFAVLALAIGLNASARAHGRLFDPAYRADQSTLRIPATPANLQLPSELEAFEPRPEPEPRSGPEVTTAAAKSIVALAESNLFAVAPKAELKLSPRADVLDLWERVRDGFALPNVEGPLVAHWQAWYLNRPQI